MTNTVDRFMQTIEGATIGEAGVFAPDGVLDARVPNWHFAVQGAASIEAELGRWYADPGRFEEIRRMALPAEMAEASRP
jgi:hypothetical protein